VIEGILRNISPVKFPQKRLKTKKNMDILYTIFVTKMFFLTSVCQTENLGKILEKNLNVSKKKLNF